MKKFAELIVGEWYAPVFYVQDKEDYVGHFYKYLGGLMFLSESDVLVEYFYDPELGMNVSADGADGFAY